MQIAEALSYLHSVNPMVSTPRVRGTPTGTQRGGTWLWCLLSFFFSACNPNACICHIVLCLQVIHRDLKLENILLSTLNKERDRSKQEAKLVVRTGAGAGKLIGLMREDT